MALAKEIMGGSIFERTSFASSSSYSKVVLNQSFGRKQNQFLRSPFIVPLEQRKAVHLSKVVRGPVAAISEDLVRKAAPSSPSVESKPVNFKVRAVVTVRNKNKEDLKETLVKKLDALTDKIGRNVVLELISTELDKSKQNFSIFVFLN